MILISTSTYSEFDKQRNEKRALEEKLAKLETKYQELADQERTEVPEKFVPKPLRDKLKWLGVDLDGTLAEHLWTPDNPTSEIGDPIWSNVDKLKKAVSAGYKPIVHTSRPWTDYQVIEQWLNHYGIPYKEIQCGKPLYAAYIDDRAIHADAESWVPNGN
jgi:hypothetical protein